MMHGAGLLTGAVLLMGGGPVAAQTPLPIPDTLNGATIDLSLQEGTWSFRPGQPVPTYGYNGDVLGPTIMLEAGQPVTLNVTNLMPDLTTTHWHGLHVSPQNDGGPHSLIYPDSTWSPSFTVLDKAGTYWYHPHGHGFTDYQVTRGAAGMIIIRDAEEQALPLPRTYGVDDLPLILQTKPVVAGEIMLHTGLDSVVVVNGVCDAAVTLPAQVVRLRCLNGSNERSLLIGLSNAMAMHVIGSDGGLLAAPVPVDRLPLHPGERYEVLLDLNGMAGQTFDLMSYGSELPNGVMGSPDVSVAGTTPDGYTDNALNGGDFRFLRITVGPQTADPVTAIPATLAVVTPYAEADADVTRTFVFAPETMGPVGMVEGPYLINGALYDMDVINEVVELGATEVWTLTNNTMVAHPFHIHDIQFHVLDRNGAPVPAHEQGRKDVVLVPPMGTVRVITRFDDFADPDMPYMYHCHILMHEDEGMMGQFLVVDGSGVADRKGDELLVWPNPAQEAITIRWGAAAGPSAATLTDARGRTVLRQAIGRGGTAARVDVSTLAPGPYVLTLTDQAGGRTARPLHITR